MLEFCHFYSFCQELFNFAMTVSDMAWAPSYQGSIISGPIIGAIGGSWTFLLFGGTTGIMLLFSILTYVISIYIAQTERGHKYTTLPLK